MSFNQYTTGVVDVAPIRRILLAWEKTQEYDADDTGIYSARLMPPPLPPLARLSHLTGINIDTLYGIKGRKAKKYVDFDVADRIICWIDPSLWRKDAELRAIYYSIDLSGLDRRRPTREAVAA